MACKAIGDDSCKSSASSAVRCSIRDGSGRGVVLVVAPVRGMHSYEGPVIGEEA